MLTGPAVAVAQGPSAAGLLVGLLPGVAEGIGLVEEGGEFAGLTLADFAHGRPGRGFDLGLRPRWLA